MPKYKSQVSIDTNIYKHHLANAKAMGFDFPTYLNFVLGVLKNKGFSIQINEAGPVPVSADDVKK